MTSFIQCVNRREEREEEGCCKETKNTLWSGQDRVRVTERRQEGGCAFNAAVFLMEQWNFKMAREFHGKMSVCYSCFLISALIAA